MASRPAAALCASQLSATFTCGLPRTPPRRFPPGPRALGLRLQGTPVRGAAHGGGPDSPARPASAPLETRQPASEKAPAPGPRRSRLLSCRRGPALPADGGARPPWLRLRAAPGGRRVSVAAPRAPAPRPGSPPPCQDGGAGPPPAARCARGLARPGAWGAWDPGRLWSQASQDQV